MSELVHRPQHRVTLHQQLLKVATGPSSAGKVPTLETGNRVKSVVSGDRKYDLGVT
jgi:hypothetical protein